MTDSVLPGVVADQEEENEEHVETEDFHNGVGVQFRYGAWTNVSSTERSLGFITQR